ncbi:MAG: prolyl oligopeptidase family serine peptidase [Pseudomonadales bacterium]|nr:prolyl oligopeptidase family serine peptidase [Pseudomonadales bacterium]
MNKTVLLLFLFSVSVSSAQEAEWAGVIADHVNGTPAPLIDRQLFLEEAAVRQVTLSPSGAHVAYTLKEGGKTALYLLDTETQEKTALFSSPKLRDVTWSDDSSLVFLELSDGAGILPVSGETGPAYISRLDRANGDYLLGPDHSTANGILVVRRNAQEAFILERILPDGATNKVFTTDERIDRAFSNRDGDVIYLQTQTEHGYFTYQLHRGERELLFSCGVNRYCSALGLSPSGGTLWLSGNLNSDLRNLLAFDLTTRTTTTVASDINQVADLASVMFLQGRPIVTRYEEGLVRNDSPDDTISEQLDALASLLPDYNLSPQLSSEGLWLVQASGATLQHPRYYLYHPESNDPVEILAQEREIAPVLEEKLLAVKFPVRYRAADGFHLYGYVSFPRGITLREAPLIARIHGGPIAKVNAGYDSFTQFLVNRGYIVFEPNFRGSTGYGMNYVLGSNRDWGNGVVQQDMIDGVHYLMDQGIGDPDKLAIVGGSFGGFAVLTGLAFTPDLFKVGVAIVPMADFGVVMRFRESQSDMVSSTPSLNARLKSLVGDIHNPGDMDRLYQQSPLAHLDQINKPLLILAGADDDRIPIAHVKDVSLQLFNQGKPMSLFIEEDEGHSNWSRYGMLSYMALQEAFLSHYLDGNSQPVMDAALRGYIAEKLLLDSTDAFQAKQ